MKNVFNTPKKVILMTAMMAMVMGYASNESTIAIDDKKAVVTLNVKQGNLLTLKNANGSIIYKEVIEHTGLLKKSFDLSKLPNGDYVIELDKDVEIKIIPFSVEETKVEFNSDEENIVYKPVTRVKENLVYVSKLALNNEKLNVKIYFEKDKWSSEYELVHEEKIEDALTLERAFKLPEDGDYKIIYNTQDRVFTEYINN